MTHEMLGPEARHKQEVRILNRVERGRPQLRTGPAPRRDRDPRARAGVRQGRRSARQQGRGEARERAAGRSERGGRPRGARAPGQRGLGLHRGGGKIELSSAEPCRYAVRLQGGEQAHGKAPGKGLCYAEAHRAVPPRQAAPCAPVRVAANAAACRLLHRLGLGRLQDHLPKHERWRAGARGPLLKVLVGLPGHGRALARRGGVVRDDKGCFASARCQAADTRLWRGRRCQGPRRRRRRDWHRPEGGLGELGHFNVRYFWLRDRVELENVELLKVKSASNPPTCPRSISAARTSRITSSSSTCTDRPAAQRRCPP